MAAFDLQCGPLASSRLVRPMLIILGLFLVLIALFVLLGLLVRGLILVFFPLLAG